MEQREDRDREKREKRNRQKGVEMTIFEGGGGYHHLPLLVVQLPQGTAVLLQRHEFPTRSTDMSPRLDSAVKRCSANS